MEENKDLIRRLVRDVWNEARAEAIDEYVHEDLRGEIVEHYRQLVAAFSDIRVSIEGDLIAEGDKVVARLLVSGTHDKGPFAGFPPTGKRLAWGSFRIYRIAGGKVAETWAMQDRLGLMEQLGVTPPVTGVNWAAGETAGPVNPPPR